MDVLSLNTSLTSGTSIIIPNNMKYKRQNPSPNESSVVYVLNGLSSNVARLMFVDSYYAYSLSSVIIIIIIALLNRWFTNADSRGEINLSIKYLDK